jgi:serine/threonine-protein kinase
MLVGQTIGKDPYRFKIEQELGSGAMGTVYRATFIRDGKDKPVALKIVALGLLGNEGAMARFEREANILKQLKHEHIVRLYATGAYRKTPFIAMEFIDGEALDRVLARRGRLTWEEVVAYGKQLCKALQYAHEKGIIHRDLKPSNLMITREGTLKLTDFGIAKDTDVTALTGHNSTIGTAAYMSPEQCKGDKNLTNKSDLYSLGIVFFEAVTGALPFTGDTAFAVLSKRCSEEPAPASSVRSGVPPEVDAMIARLLRKDPAARYATAEELLVDLRRFLGRH